MAVALVVWTVASGSLAAPALADGDPASDVLASQALFLPQDANVTPGRQAQLGALLQAAQHDGYAIRVALITSPSDLGSVTELWRHPQDYARFLAQELSLIYRGTLLVVMPNGYGLYRLAGGPATQRSALAGARPPGPNPASAAITAVQRLAAAAGHHLPLPDAKAASRPGSADTLSWAVFGIGLALMALAWRASLRARPLRPARPGTASREPH